MGACVSHERFSEFESRSMSSGLCESPSFSRGIIDVVGHKKVNVVVSTSNSVFKRKFERNNSDTLSQVNKINFQTETIGSTSTLSLKKVPTSETSSYDLSSTCSRYLKSSGESTLLCPVLDPVDQVKSSDTEDEEESDCGYFFKSYDGLGKRTTDRHEIGLEVLKAKIHCGANPKSMTTHGDRTALMFAVLAGDLCFIKELVELGVDVNKKNSSGETALGLANDIQRDDMVDYLRSKGAFEAVA